MNYFYVAAGLLLAMMALRWLLNQDKNPHLTEKDLLGLLRRGQVAKIEIEILEFRSTSRTQRQMEDQVDYSRGGRATFKISDTDGGWG